MKLYRLLGWLTYYFASPPYPPRHAPSHPPLYIWVSLVGCIDRLQCVIAQSCSHWHIKKSNSRAGKKKKTTTLGSETPESISDVAFCKSALNSEINASQVMRKRACPTIWDVFVYYERKANKKSIYKQVARTEIKDADKNIYIYKKKRKIVQNVY